MCVRFQIIVIVQVVAGDSMANDLDLRTWAAKCSGVIREIKKRAINLSRIRTGPLVGHWVKS